MMDYSPEESETLQIDIVPAQPGYFLLVLEDPADMDNPNGRPIIIVRKPIIAWSVQSTRLQYKMAYGKAQPQRTIDRVFVNTITMPVIIDFVGCDISNPHAVLSPVGTLEDVENDESFPTEDEWIDWTIKHHKEIQEMKARHTGDSGE